MFPSQMCPECVCSIGGDGAVLAQQPVLIDHLPYELMQLQTSIRSCEGHHCVVTVINGGAGDSGSSLQQSQGANRGCAHPQNDHCGRKEMKTWLKLYRVFSH